MSYLWVFRIKVHAAIDQHLYEEIFFTFLGVLAKRIHKCPFVNLGYSVWRVLVVPLGCDVMHGISEGGVEAIDVRS